MHRLHLVVVMVASGLAFAAQAAVPAFIPYSGRLSDGTAWGQSTTLDLTLTLYDAAEGGAVVFQGKHQDAQVVDGYFTVNLGMCNDQGACDPNPANATFPASLPAALWLGVSVDDRTELPRVPVGSVPYCVQADNAGTLAGNAADAFLWNQTSVAQPASFRIAGSGVVEGSLAVGVSSPASTLHVAADDHGSHAERPVVLIDNTSSAAGVDHRAELQLKARDATGTVRMSAVMHMDNNLYLRGAKDVILQSLSSGSVGVGTISPAKTLDVNGDARVSGTLFAGCGVQTGPSTASGTNLASPAVACPGDAVVVGGGAACVGSNHRLLSTVLDGPHKFKADIMRSDSTATSCWAWAMCCRVGN